MKDTVPFRGEECPQASTYDNGSTCPTLLAHMNLFNIGTTPIEVPKGGFLLIADELPAVPRAKIFDPTKHSFNPLKDIDYRKAMDIVDTFDALFSRGDSTLTKDTGLDFIADALETGTSFEDLIPEPDKKASTGHIWAYGKVRRLMRSPVLKRVLCSPTNFSFNSRYILARLNRAELGDFDALALGHFLIGQFKGQVIVYDGGFYLRDTHLSLIRENRLIAGVRFLDELPEKLRLSVLMEEIVVGGTTYDDAVLIAKHLGLRPDQLREDNAFNQFVDRAIETA